MPLEDFDPGPDASQIESVLGHKLARNHPEYWEKVIAAYDGTCEDPRDDLFTIDYGQHMAWLNDEGTVLVQGFRNFSYDALEVIVSRFVDKNGKVCSVFDGGAPEEIKDD